MRLTNLPLMVATLGAGLVVAACDSAKSKMESGAGGAGGAGAGGAGVGDGGVAAEAGAAACPATRPDGECSGWKTCWFPGPTCCREIYATPCTCTNGRVSCASVDLFCSPNAAECADGGVDATASILTACPAARPDTYLPFACTGSFTCSYGCYGPALPASACHCENGAFTCEEFADASLAPPCAADAAVD